MERKGGGFGEGWKGNVTLKSPLRGIHLAETYTSLTQLILVFPPFSPIQRKLAWT